LTQIVPGTICTQVTRNIAALDLSAAAEANVCVT